MYKLILSIFLLSNFLYSNIIEKVQVLEVNQKKLSIKDIKKSKNFKDTELPFIKKTDQDIFIKLTIQKDLQNSKQKILELDNKFNDIEISKKFNKLILEKNQNFEEFYLTKYIGLDLKKPTENIYLKIQNENGFVNFNATIHDKKQYETKNSLLNKLFGISYGIIFASFLFYFSFYIFNKEKSFIYYSLTQLSILVVLLLSAYKSFEFTESYTELGLLFFLIFSNLFTRSFFNTKKNFPNLDKILLFVLFLFILEYLLIEYFDFDDYVRDIPISFFLSIYIITALFALKKGQKEAIFYLIAWGLVIFTVFLIEYHNIFFALNPIYITHIFIPLESLILAFALSYKMKILTLEKESQKELAIQQNKLASMGEMLANIAHQWRQPLTHLSYILMNLEARFERKKLSEEYFKEKTKEATSQLEFMSETIDNFKDFFKTSKQDDNFSIKQMLEETIFLLDKSFQSLGIKIKLHYENDLLIYSNQKEFRQVIFNLLMNAKDALLLRKIDPAIIEISFKTKSNILIIEVSDNAGGIDEKIINKIYEPYFSTKENGLGIGLYMSKTIIEKSIKGTLEAKNSHKGARFIIKVPL